MRNIQIKYFIIAAISFIAVPSLCFARDLEYNEQEVAIRVAPGEPTQIRFPGIVAGGYKKSYSAISLEKKDGDLIIFANEKIDEPGEAIVVRLKDGRSYSVRLQKANAENPRDDVVKIRDKRGSIISSEEEETPDYKEKHYDYAPPSVVSGLMREIVLAAEFGKSKVSGYQVTDQYKGETIMNDGTVNATIDRIYIGPNLWGYVIDVKNMLDVGQKLNPATFRLDGTRAISFKDWELAARPLDTEQQIAGKDSTKAYIVTRAR
jgi:hypothetical protein